MSIIGHDRVIFETDAVSLCAGYLMDACTANGRFVYRVNLDPAVVLKPRYNILRHAGAMYALALYHTRRPTADAVGRRV